MPVLNGKRPTYVNLGVRFGCCCTYRCRLLANRRIDTSVNPPDQHRVVVNHSRPLAASSSFKSPSISSDILATVHEKSSTASANCRSVRVMGARDARAHARTGPHASERATCRVAVSRDDRSHPVTSVAGTQSRNDRKTFQAAQPPLRNRKRIVAKSGHRNRSTYRMRL